MTQSSLTTPPVRIRSRIAGWLPTTRRRQLLAVREAFGVGYRIGERDGHETGYQNGRDDA